MTHHNPTSDRTLFDTYVAQCLLKKGTTLICPERRHHDGQPVARPRDLFGDDLEMQMPGDLVAGLIGIHEMVGHVPGRW